MSSELKVALEGLERDKEIQRDSILEAISNSLMSACRSCFVSVENIRVDIDREECELHVIATKYVLPEGEEVRDDEVEITLEDARKINPDVKEWDEVDVELDSKQFSRIATQTAKSVITQKIREEERRVILDQFMSYLNKVITGTVQRRMNRGWYINLGKIDALLPETEMVPGERLKVGNRIKVFVKNVEDTNKGARITVSRKHENLVKCLFEEEVTEIRDGIVEIMKVAREPGSRSKMAVISHNPNVDPVGACVGVNGSRVNVVVNELFGEKIDIINWDDNPGVLIQNALSPARIENVFADPESKEAKVVVPDDQLSLAIGKQGQNARLVALLTKFKIDIKSSTQAQDAFGFRIEDYQGYDDGQDMYDENGEYIYDEEGVEETYEEGGNVPAGEDGEDNE